MSWLVEFITKEWKVLRGAPASALLFMAVGWGLAGLLYYGQRDERITERTEGYRRALGISEGYTNIFIDLTNDDLRAKTKTAVDRIREIRLAADARINNLVSRLASDEITQKQFNDLHEESLQQMRAAFSRELRSEAISLATELRYRLSPEARRGIIGAGPLLDRGITYENLIPEQFNEFAMTFLVGELEQMANRLPPDKHEWWIWPSILISVAVLILLLFWAIHSGVRIVRIQGPIDPPPSPE